MHEDRSGYWSEHYGTLDDVVAEVMLTAEPCTLVTILQGDPDDPERVLYLWIQPWGQA